MEETILNSQKQIRKKRFSMLDNSILLPRLFQVLFLMFLLLIFLIFIFGPLVAIGAELKGIFSNNGQSGIRLEVTEKIPGKMIMVDDKEILIALKNIRPAKQMMHWHKASDLIRKIEVDELPGNVLAIVVTGKVAFKSVEHSWDKSGLNLIVNFNGVTNHSKEKSNSPKQEQQKRELPKKDQSKIAKSKKAKSSDSIKSPDSIELIQKIKEPHGAKSAPLTAKSAPLTTELAPDSAESTPKPSPKSDHQITSENIESTPQNIEEIKKNASQKKYGSRKNRLSDIAGDITDIVTAVDLMQCNNNELKNAYQVLKQSQWKYAFDILNGYLENGGKDCVEQADYLRAYAFYQSIQNGDSNPANEGDSKSANEGASKSANEGDSKSANEGNSKSANEGNSKSANEGNSKSAHESAANSVHEGGSGDAEKSDTTPIHNTKDDAGHISNYKFEQLLKAESLFHNLLINWPSSPLIPFAHTALGLIYYKLENIAVAEGYFSIVANDYKSYTGMPEVLYYLGNIYYQKGNQDKEYNDKAIKNYREVFNNCSKSVYAVDAGVGLGKALFKKLQYIESRDILTSLVESNPEIIYDSPEILRSIGEAEYALHNNIPARENLNRVYNLFSNISDKDMIMTKVGDTYFYEKKIERAKAVYQFVMDKFPGTEGFLGSSMGLALCLTDRPKIEQIYNMVKTDFGDHRLSKVAMMRLAELYNKNGEYERCIEEIENLLSTHPAGLRYDAVKLMQSAYESLLKKKFKSGEYPEVLKTYEDKKALLDKFESKEIFLTTGLSYLNAHLYEQAFNQLMESYKQYKKTERPPELLFGLGVAMDESGKKDDAINILRSYTERVEKGAQKVEAYTRIGTILFDKGELTKSSKNFKSAYEFSKDRIEKGNILSRQAEIYQKLNQWDKVSELFEKAVTEYASATGKNYELISGAYKSLGKSYLEQKSFVKAAESFNMALKISDTAGYNSIDIVFMLGDAYQKANVLEKAKEAFEKVAGTEDSIWARLAKERLTTLALAEKVSNS